jgi:hypothetical protein
MCFHLHMIDEIENYKVCWPSVKGDNVRYFGWPQVSQTAWEKPLPGLRPFAGGREANTKPIGLGPLPTAPLYKRGSPPGDLSQSIYRVSTNTLVCRSVRALEGSEARVPTARRHRRRPESHGRRGDAPALSRLVPSSTPPLRRLRRARWIPPLPVLDLLWPIPHYFKY